jgi:hypothetical protein
MAAAGVAALAPATLALGWLAVPFTYGRFMILATGSVGVVAALAARRWPRTTVAAVTAGALTQYVVVGDRWHALVVAALGIAVGSGLVMESSARRGVRRRPMAPAVASALLLALGMGVAAATHPAVIDAAPRRWRPGLRRIGALPPEARIAYAGNNVPYLLRGPGHSVLHVPLDGDLSGRFDTRAARWAKTGLPPAVSPSPGFDRGVQDAKAWLDALRTARIDALVVTPLAGAQLVQIRHDGRGMPIEDVWARAAAPALEAVHLDDALHIYSLHPEREPASPLPPSRERREPDAFALLFHPRALARKYPLGVAEIALPQYARVRRRVAQMPQEGRPARLHD